MRILPTPTSSIWSSVTRHLQANLKPLETSQGPACALAPRPASGYCKFLELLLEGAWAGATAPSPGPCANGPLLNLMPISGDHIPDTGGEAAIVARVGVGAVRGSSAEAGGW